MHRLLVAGLVLMPAYVWATPLISVRGGGSLVADEGPTFLTLSAHGSSPEGDFVYFFATNYVPPFSSDPCLRGAYSCTSSVTLSSGENYNSHYFVYQLGDYGYLNLLTSAGEPIVSVPIRGYLNYGSPDIDRLNRTFEQGISILDTPEPGTFISSCLTLVAAAIGYLRRRTESAPAA